MKTYSLFVAVMLMAMGLMGCEPSEPGTTALISSESFLTSEVRIVQEPSIAKIENAKLGVPTPLGCKVVPNNLKQQMQWVVTPSTNVKMEFSKDSRMLKLTLLAEGRYSVSCALDVAVATFDIMMENYIEPPVVEPPAEGPPALPADPEPAFDDPAPEPVMWEACPEGSSGTGCLTGKAVMVPWDDSFTRCAALREEGYSDWRVPSTHLLYSLVDPSRTSGAMINQTLFPRTPAAAFWSREQNAQTASTAWGVLFDKGQALCAAKTALRYVRCVRGGTELEQAAFQRDDRDEPTVQDLRTGLIWMGCTAGTTGQDCHGVELRLLQLGARAFCASLNWAGQTGWRLPMIFELHSLVALNAWYPAVDNTQFLGFRQGTETWSGTPRTPGSTVEAYIVDFNYGVVRSQLSAFTRPFRCVK